MANFFEKLGGAIKDFTTGNWNDDIGKFIKSIPNKVGEFKNKWSGQVDQREYQTELANTAHQREMADLKAAGINPAITAINGNGAYSGASSIGTSNIMSGIAGVINSAANVLGVMKQGPMKAAERMVTQQIFNSAGKLMKTAETYSRDY